MITYTTGNIFESKAECLVNTVNCEGYMGKGIAYQFKLRFPQNNNDYAKACRSGDLHIGTIHHFYEDGVLIVNLPTKDKWREKSKVEYVEVGLDRLVELIEKKNIKSIAIPPLGCGNGGLDWHVVKKIINQRLEEVADNCEIIVYEPSGSYQASPRSAPKVSVSALVLLKIRMQLDKFGALRLQKAGYFMNYFLGEAYFKYDKWNYGPYSHSVDIVARSIREYQQYYNIDNSRDTYDHIINVICSKKTDEKLNMLFPAIEKATEYVNSISSDKMLEGVATVLYIVQKNNGNCNEEKTVKLFQEWSDDKAKRFSRKYICECIEYLINTGIILRNRCGEFEVV